MEDVIKKLEEWAEFMASLQKNASLTREKHFPLTFEVLLEG